MIVNNNLQSWEEDYEVYTDEESVLRNEVADMESHSLWMEGNISKDLNLVGIPSPIEAMDIAAKYGLEIERTMENANGFISGGTPDTRDRATGLVLDYIVIDKKKGAFHAYKNISRAAWGTLCETAKLSGSALTRMAPLQLADCLNNGMDVARGKTLLLLRYDKVMAMHSDSETGYCVMPISSLLTVARSCLEEKFGAVNFVEGRHSNVFTTALWTLPDVQNEIIEKYQRALDHAASQLHAINFMPAVRFSASDTARSSAVMKPMFVRSNGVAVTFGGDVAVKHEKKRVGTFGIELFEEESGKLFARFNETAELIQKMAETEIYNPVNTIVGIFNFLNRGNSVIKRQYADVARREVESFSVNFPVMSMHDIYLSMFESVAAARIDGVTNTSKMEEALAKVLMMDWKAYDVGGVVAWGEKVGNV